MERWVEYFTFWHFLTVSLKPPFLHILLLTLSDDNHLKSGHYWPSKLVTKMPPLCVSKAPRGISPHNALVWVSKPTNVQLLSPRKKRGNRKHSESSYFPPKAALPLRFIIVQKSGSALIQSWNFIRIYLYGLFIQDKTRLEHVQKIPYCIMLRSLFKKSWILTTTTPNLIWISWNLLILAFDKSC